jgi:putative effector of murein hydrolase LrgA (UPF0299 family)
MIRGILILLLCQLAGESLARGFNLPAPGPVIGMALLAIGLVAWRRWRPFDDKALEASELGKASGVLLGTLSLLFVPAGVGVVQYFGLLTQYGVALAASLIVSTVATLLATVFVFLAVKRLFTRGVAGSP